MFTRFLACFLFVTGCTTTYQPASNLDDLKTQEASFAPAKPAYLGLSVLFSLDLFEGNAEVTLEFLETKTGKVFHVPVKSGEASSADYLPVLVAIPPGDYLLTQVELFLPSRRINGDRYHPFRGKLAAHQGMPAFTVRENQFLHLSNVEFKIAHVQSDGKLRVNAAYQMTFAPPRRERWASFLPKLERGRTDYLHNGQAEDLGWAHK